MIDLRSDTVTRPTDAMRQIMAKAEVGDDQFGEDPSINRLQERVAALLGKESGLWLPTGTMANQVALRTLTQPGDDVIVSAGAHVVWSETGAGAANAGVQFTELGGTRGYFDVDSFRRAVKPRDDIVLPPTTLVTIENTHNHAGGRAVPIGVMSEVCEAAAAIGVTGLSPAALAAPFDVVWVAFSKGLGAPGGAMLAGSADFIARARRFRRMMGGAMRQVGVFAAAADYALTHHLDDLAADHLNARSMAEILSASSRVEFDLDSVETNIIYFDLNDEAPGAEEVMATAAESGVLVLALGPSTIRVVTHRDVTTEECLSAAHRLVEVIES